MLRNPRASGFTIVELLIVIVVIGILAALVLNTFSNSQARARDTKRRADLSQIKKSLLQHEAVEGHMFYSGSGCGSQGNGSGWFNLANPALNYPESIENCLKDSGYLSQEIIDPSGKPNCTGASCHAYMKYNCWESGQYVVYLFANLESLPQDANALNDTCAPNNDTAFGMNYVLRVN
jgi:prepilin-type N-terminal cleavage/methylation domain-containing protein